MKTRAYAVSQLGIIGLPTVCYTQRQCREISVQTEREYFPDEVAGMSDSQIWRRLYRQGFRVIPVTIIPQQGPSVTKERSQEG